jgi:hypothetical protein
LRTEHHGWNRGDLDGLMVRYLRSADLLFRSGGGVWRCRGATYRTARRRPLGADRQRSRSTTSVVLAVCSEGWGLAHGRTSSDPWRAHTIGGATVVAVFDSSRERLNDMKDRLEHVRRTFPALTPTVREPIYGSAVKVTALPSSCH